MEPETEAEHERAEREGAIEGHAINGLRGANRAGAAIQEAVDGDDGGEEDAGEIMERLRESRRGDDRYHNGKQVLLVKLLLEAGASVHCRDYLHETALHMR